MRAEDFIFSKLTIKQSPSSESQNSPSRPPTGASPSQWSASASPSSSSSSSCRATTSRDGLLISAPGSDSAGKRMQRTPILLLLPPPAPRTDPRGSGGGASAAGTPSRRCPGLLVPIPHLRRESAGASSFGRLLLLTWTSETRRLPGKRRKRKRLPGTGGSGAGRGRGRRFRQADDGSKEWRSCMGSRLFE